LSVCFSAAVLHPSSVRPGALFFPLGAGDRCTNAVFPTGVFSSEQFRIVSSLVAKKTKSPVTVEQIDGMIRTLRGTRVILDSDLAKIYGVPTFRFNEAIKRNRHRFPPDFMFSLPVRSSTL
jgi:ORF6N domain-containing protein